MKNTFRKIVMASVAMAAIVVGASAASAESTVNVPFAFKIGNKVCPAGSYIVKPGFNHNLVTLQNRDAQVNFAWILMPGDGTNKDAKISLKFDQIGDTELLKSVQVGSQKTPVIDKGAKSLERPITQVIQGQ
jgi:hypothetical protein